MKVTFIKNSITWFSVGLYLLFVLFIPVNPALCSNLKSSEHSFSTSTSSCCETLANHSSVSQSNDDCFNHCVKSSPYKSKQDNATIQQNYTGTDTLSSCCTQISKIITFNYHSGSNIVIKPLLSINNNLDMLRTVILLN